MKHCSAYRELFTDALYGELTGERLTGLNQHLKTCPSCAHEYNHLVETLSIMDQRERPESNDRESDDFWERLEERIDNEEVLVKGNFKNRWKVYYPLSAAALVIIGILIGKVLYSPTKSLPLQGTTAYNNQSTVGTKNVTPTLTRHFDNLKPLLLEYANYTPGEETLGVEKEVLKKLILENYLLKRAVAKKGDKPTQVLLEELELVLLEMSGTDREPGDTDLIKDFIKENDIIFKMNIQDKRSKKNNYTQI